MSTKHILYPSFHIWIRLPDLSSVHGSESPWGTAKLSTEQKGSFYRWLIFMSANVYPLRKLYRYPGRYITIPSDASVKAEEVQEWVKNGAAKKQDEIWKLVEEHFCNLKTREEGTFLLGTRLPTVLDVIVSIMAHYGPCWPDDPPVR